MQFIILILLPLFSFAHDEAGGISYQGFLSEVLTVSSNAFHYQLFNLDNQSITIGNIVIAFIALIIGLKLARRFSKSFKRKLFSLISFDSNSANLMSRVIDYLVMGIIILIALDLAGVPVTIFTFIGGALVISIGLSSQHLINNFLSGIAVIIEGKIKVGDIIGFNDIIGKVENIETRMIMIKSQDNIEHFIPHSKLMQEYFANWSYNGGRIRIATNIRIDQNDHANSDLETIILNAVSQSKKILARPKPQILLLSFDDNILNYEVNFWINLAETDRRIALSDVNNHILNALRSYQISLSIPTRRFTE
ncbi:MAG: mechanosensitive ion channel domain-containing protein [Pseudomonadota bacterium]